MNSIEEFECQIKFIVLHYIKTGAATLPEKQPWLLRQLEHTHHTVPVARVPLGSLDVVPDYAVLATPAAQRTAVHAHGYAGHGPVEGKI